LHAGKTLGVLILTLFFFLAAACGETGTKGEEAVGGEASLPWSTRSFDYLAITPLPPPKPHDFWDRTNRYLLSGVALMRTLDYTSTLNMQRRGREEILLPDDVVNNRAGFAALEAASTATSIGIAYLFHATGHHKLERWVSIGHISVAGFGVARNYALKSHHPAP